ncbi:hypothetical protein HBB16_01230 [Pseudonocardia sp. MCCB 268]|nr:hypothetical protein [Pseudonocardia cytotoxica]
MDDRDTIVTTRSTRNVDTGGGDFDQRSRPTRSPPGRRRRRRRHRGLHGHHRQRQHRRRRQQRGGRRRQHRRVRIRQRDQHGDVSADDGSMVSVGGNASGSHDATGLVQRDHHDHDERDRDRGPVQPGQQPDNDSSFENNSQTHTDTNSHNTLEVDA